MEFLTTKGIVARIDDVIKKAEHELVLVSPYIKFSESFQERLQYADAKKIRINIIYGKATLREEARTVLARLKNLHLYFCDNLHAKCYFNEQFMVITSMNLYEASEGNREMGIFVTREHPVYTEAMEEAKVIRAVSEEEKRSRGSLLDSPVASSLSRMARQALKMDERATGRGGHCIRCKRPIPHKPGAPYCRDCFSVWVQWEDPYYEEKYCHTCGKKADTSMAKPLCYSCFRSSN